MSNSNWFKRTVWSPSVETLSFLFKSKPFWFVLIFSIIWFGFNNSANTLFLPDEGRYVGVAYEMKERGDWLTPVLDGMPFFHKPPLFYWLAALSLSTFGVNEFAARFTSMVSALSIVVAMYFFVKAYSNKRSAGITALMIALCPLIFGASQYANLDTLVAAMISVTIIFAGAAVFSMKRNVPYKTLLLWAYFFAGLGFLSKGLIGVVLPGGVIFFWLCASKRFDLIAKLFYLPGIILMLAVIMPWLIWMEIQYPGFIKYYVVYQQITRFLETGFNNSQPFWFYWGILFICALPWCSHWIAYFKNKQWLETENNDLTLLMGVWFLLITIFFSIPNSKLVGYILPSLPPLMYLLAQPFITAIYYPQIESKATKHFRIGVIACLILGFIAAITLQVQPRPTNKVFTDIIKKTYEPGDRTVMIYFYGYDYNFYMKQVHDLYVVDVWNKPEEIARSDNWRKELFDSYRFAPDAKNLLTENAFIQYLCKPRSENTWLMMNPNEVDSNYPFLKGFAPLHQTKRMGLWYLSKTWLLQGDYCDRSLASNAPVAPSATAVDNAKQVDNSVANVVINTPQEQSNVKSESALNTEQNANQNSDNGLNTQSADSLSNKKSQNDTLSVEPDSKNQLEAHAQTLDKGVEYDSNASKASVNSDVVPKHQDDKTAQPEQNNSVVTPNLSNDSANKHTLDQSQSSSASPSADSIDSVNDLNKQENSEHKVINTNI